MIKNTVSRELSEEQLEQVVGGTIGNSNANVNVAFVDQTNKVINSDVRRGSSVGGAYVSQSNTSYQKTRVRWW